jgi:transposase-like protein
MSSRNQEDPRNASPEVPEKASRRRFDAAYKLKIVQEADRCREPGKIGELLRREGLYSSQLAAWRKQRDEGALDGLEGKQRGRKPQRKDARDQELQRLRKENEELQRRLRQAETIIDVQKKVSEILGISPSESDEHT